MHQQKAAGPLRIGALNELSSLGLMSGELPNS
jgi:hypothetical protein